MVHRETFIAQQLHFQNPGDFIWLSACFYQKICYFICFIYFSLKCLRTNDSRKKTIVRFIL